MAREYPRQAFLSAVAEAAHYGLYDMHRLERMILRRIANDYLHLARLGKPVILKGAIMAQELEQLMKNPRLKRMIQIYGEQLRAAEKEDPPIPSF